MLENRVFFTKDTLFTPKFVPAKRSINTQYKRPALYSPAEWHEKRIKDSLLAIKADSVALAKQDSLRSKKLDSLKANRLGRLKLWLDSLLPTPTPEQIYQKRFYKNHYITAKPDTNMDFIHQYNNILVNRNIYQNLGILGTPSKAVFPEFKPIIGYHSGFRVMDLYFSEPDNSLYYNTRSPYTYINYVGFPGTSEEDRIKVEVNRNITRSWNVGLSYERLDSRKQIGRTSRQESALLLGQEFRLYTSGRSRSERYHFMGSFTYFGYKINEQGGLVPFNANRTASEENTLPSAEAPADFAGWPVWLNAPNSGYNPWSVEGNIYTRDRRVAYRFYHQFDILKRGKLAVFHEFDRRNQKYRYGDPTFAQTGIDTTFYKGAALYNDTTKFNYEFAYISNKIGAKTNIEKLTLIAYLKQRDVWAAHELTAINLFAIAERPWGAYKNWVVNDPLSQIRLREHYAGANAVYRLNDSVHVTISIEQMLGLTNYSTNAAFKNYFNYKADFYAEATIKWHTQWKAGLGASRAAPSMFSIYSMMHNHYFWWNNFKSVNTFHAFALYNLNYKKNFFCLKPWLFTTQNPVYYTVVTNEFNSQKQFTALQFTQSMVSYFFTDATVNLKLWKIHLDNFVRLTTRLKDEENIFRMPVVFVNSQTYFRYVPAKKAFTQDFRIGFDIFYRSQYFGDAYMPAAGQFFLQNEFPLISNALVDFYIAAKMRNARFFLKMNQLNQLLQLTRGYYITPYYPGTRGSFAFGIQWYFFD